MRIQVECPGCCRGLKVEFTDQLSVELSKGGQDRIDDLDECPFCNIKFKVTVEATVRRV